MAALWGVTTGGIRGNDDEQCSTPVVQQFEWSQICQRWAINTLIAVIVLTLLTVLVTYFGHTFSLESNRTYFIILLVSLFAITFIISALFCTNRKRKTQSEQKKNNERLQRQQQLQQQVSTERQAGIAQPHEYDVNSGINSVNAIAVDL